MPLTKLEPSAALVVIDLQKGIVSIPTAHPAADIVKYASELARAFRAASMPVVLVNVNGRAPGRTEAQMPKFAPAPDWAELVPQLDPQPGDHLVTKQRFGAFIGTSLDAYLRSLGVTQIVLAGISTSAGVESTARSAFDLGYHVVFALDAMTDREPAMHQHCVEKVFPRLGETAQTADVLIAITKRL